MQILQSTIGSGAWKRLSTLLEFSCTKPEWIVLDFEDGALVGALALVAPNEFNVPLEIMRVHGREDRKTYELPLFERAIERGRSLGTRELYYTVSEDSTDVAAISEALFRPWRKIVRFESAGPIESAMPGYRSAEVNNFNRADIIALLEKTAEHSGDSQIAHYRRLLGTFADANLTLQMLDSTRYDPSWWRVALNTAARTVGIILPVVAFGELTVGFIGVIPEYRGRNVASFLLSEAWSFIKPKGRISLSAEADERNVSMHRALMKSQFSRRAEKQEWRLELG